MKMHFMQLRQALVYYFYKIHLWLEMRPLLVKKLESQVYSMVFDHLPIEIKSKFF